MNFRNFFSTRKALCIAGAMVASTSVVQAAPDQFSKTTGKKLIEYGWDRPSPEYTRDNIRQMEKTPFEGVIMRLPDNGGNVFTVQGWSALQPNLQGQLPILSSIKWGKFTDNFIAMYSASDMDWYSDENWQIVLERVKFCAKAAKAAGCVGLMFDPEAYGKKTSPWNYAVQPHAKKYSYTQYAEKVQQRGKQFMEAMQSEMPSIKVLPLFGYNLMYRYSHNPANGTDAAKLATAFQDRSYGLMLPFWNGVIEGASPGSQLIDGNEESYYYEKTADFVDSYKAMRQGIKANLPDSLKAKFDAHNRAGQSLYPDHVYALRPEYKYISSFMTPQQQDLWFEQNVYNALKYSDEYVWLYGQHMNWWTGSDLPENITQAIISAKSKLEKGLPFGFDSTPIFDEARAKEQQYYFEGTETLRAPATSAPRQGNNTVYTYRRFDFLQFAQKGQTITFNITALKAYPEDTELELRDPHGKLLQFVDISLDGKTRPFSFTASETGIYRLSRAQHLTQLIDVDSSASGNGFYIKGGGVFLFQPGGKLYFEVPSDVKNFTISFTTPSPKNRADVAVIDAQGKTVGQQSISYEKSYEFSTTRSDTSSSEIWAIDISNANWGVRVKMGDKLMPVVSTNPETMLRKKVNRIYPVP